MTAPATEPAPAGFRTKVDRLAEARRAKLEGMAEDLASQHSAACKEAHVRKKRELTWGCILPTIMPGKDGLVHVSQISNERVEKVSDKLKEGQIVKVKVMETDEKGRIKLSMKALIEREEGAAQQQQQQ